MAGQLAGILILLVVEVFVIDLEEAVEFHHRAGGAEDVMLAVAAIGTDVGGGALQFGAFHLAGDGALPDRGRRGRTGRHRDARRTLAGRRERSVGRIASWASCAFFALVVYMRGEEGR